MMHLLVRWKLEVREYVNKRDAKWIGFTRRRLAEFNDETRNYAYLHGVLRRHNDFASKLFGRYPQYMPDAYTPFQLLGKEKQKKAYPLAYFIAARVPLDVSEARRRSRVAIAYCLSPWRFRGKALV
jgi:hypothetical protein